MSVLSLPKRRGRQSPEQEARFGADLDAWCAGIRQINSTLDFRVSSRGWCYILEQHGLLKGDLSAAQRLINDCRKSGRLPLDICSEDQGRAADGLEDIDGEDVADRAAAILDYVRTGHEYYTPVSFWESQSVYIEMAVEKVDLKSLFSSVCERFSIPITNMSGWNDLNSRAAIMRRFSQWEAEGKRCVLLYCGDHDPGGLHISGFLHSNFNDLADAVGWAPDDLVIERFGLDFDFIEAQRLSWIENLETSGGKYPLDHPRHSDHDKPYVQSYLRRFGTRKCEANALVTRPAAGRELCRQAILRHIPETAIAEYSATLDLAREALRDEIQRRIDERALS